MSLAFGAIGTVNTTSSYTSLAVSGSNTLGVVQVVGDSAADNITAVTWGGVSMTKVNAVKTPSNRWMSVWVVANPTTASTIAFTGGSFWRSYASYYTGANQTGQPDSSNTGTQSGATSLAVATTVVASNCWTIYFTKDVSGAETYTTNVGSMRVAADDGGLAISDSNGTVSTGSQSTTHTTGSAQNMGGIAFSIAPVAAASGNRNTGFFMFG